MSAIGALIASQMAVLAAQQSAAQTRDTHTWRKRERIRRLAGVDEPRATTYIGPPEDLMATTDDPRDA